MAKNKLIPQKPTVEPVAKTSRPAESVVAPVSMPAPTRSAIKIPTAVAKPAAMPFGPGNYQLMALGVVVVLVGFFVMTLDQEPFGFGVLGLTAGPLLVMSGFIIEFFAILRK
jgi:Protein of unknown function (DUF3098)